MIPHILLYLPLLNEAWINNGVTILIVPMKNRPSAMYQNDGTGPYHYTQWPKTAWITRHPTPMGCEDHIAIPPFQSGDIVALTAECHSVRVRILEMLAPKRFNDLSTSEWDSANYPMSTPWNEWWLSYSWTSNPYCWRYQAERTKP